jgi:N-glycosylase/DNA lyase
MELSYGHGRMMTPLREAPICSVPAVNLFTEFTVEHYSLSHTLDSGQVFRWSRQEHSWIGVVAGRWVRLTESRGAILAQTAEPVSDWRWLTHYLQLDVDLNTVIESFPDDEPLRAAKAACHGLRLLKQDPWECLASFILSSTKQIVQIRQIISLLCQRYGKLVQVPYNEIPAYAFPTAAALAATSESELRDCKMGFRAPYLLETARIVAEGKLDLEELHHLPVEAARAKLLELPGVGRKIADCVLLFAYGFPTAFPIDVWVLKALRQLYFPKRKVKIRKLQEFAASYFGAWGGYAQQYLFHYMRTQRRHESP